jgi:RimJ/RimL family protein N-acetyltransferase
VEVCRAPTWNLRLTPRSIRGASTSLEDTENSLKAYLNYAGGQGVYRIGYAVHVCHPGRPAEFIGVVALKSLDDKSLPLPEALTAPAADTGTLTVELSYMFLPSAWGKGYATEAVKAVVASCEQRSPWSPFKRVYLRAIVNRENPGSRRVMDKIGIAERGLYEWKGEQIYLAGQWRTQGWLHIYGMYLIDSEPS